MDSLELAQDCRNRMMQYQIEGQTLMGDVRGHVEPHIYDTLTVLTAAVGNAAYEIGCLMDEIKQLRRQVAEK